MKNNNELVEYKENIFTKIKIFLLNSFGKKQNQDKKVEEKKKMQNAYNEIVEKKDIRKEYTIKKDEEEERIKNLKYKFDNGVIDEEDIDEKDVEKLVRLYNMETLKLNEDTERRKIHIKNMLQELKKIC